MEKMNSDGFAPRSPLDAERLPFMDKLHDKILGSRVGSLILGTTTFLYLCFCIYNFVVRPPIIHEELMITMPKLVNKADESFLAGLFQKTFNLEIVEDAGYRSRALGYLVGYIEPNLIVKINEVFPAWSVRQPFLYVGMFLGFLICAKLIRGLFPTISRYGGLFAASSLLFFANLQTGLYIVNGRSAKVLLLPACLFLAYYFIKNIETYIDVSLKKLSYLALSSCGVFVLMTLDEQVLAAVCCMTVSAFIISVLQRRVNVVSVIYFAASALYATFHLWWGRAIFQIFTPTSLVTNIHNIGTLYSSLSPRHVSASWEILQHVMGSFFASNTVFVAVACLVTVLWSMLGNYKEKLIPVLFILSADAITIACILSQTPAYDYKDLWNSNYFCVPFVFIFASMLYVLSKTKMFSQKSIAVFLVLGMGSIAGVNMQSIDKYYTNFLRPFGGHIGVFYSWEHPKVEGAQASLFDGALSEKNFEKTLDSMKTYVDQLKSAGKFKGMEPITPIVQRPLIWYANESLTELNLFGEWDNVLSLFQSLKYHLSRFATIPHWDVTLSGGRSTLANPNSFAFTWPSLLVYLMPPIWAALSFWVLLTVTGFLSMFFLLRRFRLGGVGAFCGAFIFCFNGYFASHFNQGQVVFAAFHLLPLLILCFDWAITRCLEGQTIVWQLLCVIGTTFAFLTSASLFGLVYFYPAFLLYLLVCPFVWKKNGGPRSKNFRRFALILWGHLLGFVLAAYKLGPIWAWQLEYPPVIAAKEYTPPSAIMAHYVRMVTDYFEFNSRYWEYNAYVGPAVLLTTIVALYFSVKFRGRKQPSSIQPASAGVILGCCSLVLGILFVLGREYFAYLPILNRISTFGRHHVLDVFGFSLLAAYGVHFINRSEWLRNLPVLWQTFVMRSIVFVLLAPLFYQSVCLIWNIEGIADNKLKEAIYVGIAETIETPKMIRAWNRDDITTQNILLKHGYFPIESPQSNGGIGLTFENVPVGMTWPLATTPYHKFSVASNSISFEFEKEIASPLRINLPVYPFFRPDIEPSSVNSGFYDYAPDKIAGKKLTIDTTINADKVSMYVSAMGLFVTIMTSFVVWFRQKGPSVPYARCTVRR